MRSFFFLAALSAFTLLSACEKEKQAEPMAAASATAAAQATAPPAATAAATAPATAPSPENIPVAADFEDEAEKSITKANYRAELDSLEAEIK